MKKNGWRHVKALYRDDLLPSREVAIGWTERFSSLNPIRARVEAANCLADVRGSDVVLDRAFADALSTPEPIPPSENWQDEDGKTHHRQPDGSLRRSWGQKGKELREGCA